MVRVKIIYKAAGIWDSPRVYAVTSALGQLGSLKSLHDYLGFNKPMNLYIRRVDIEKDYGVTEEPKEEEEKGNGLVFIDIGKGITVGKSRDYYQFSVLINAKDQDGYHYTILIRIGFTWTKNIKQLVYCSAELRQKIHESQLKLGSSAEEISKPEKVFFGK